jgi:hypothetical protein
MSTNNRGELLMLDKKTRRLVSHMLRLAGENRERVVNGALEGGDD